MCLWAFSIMMMTASTMAPMAMAMPPSDMMLELMPCAIHDQERDQHGDGQDDDGHQRAAQVQEEREADQRHDDAFLEQLFLQRLDGALDQRAAVVGDGIGHVGRQALHGLRPASSSRPE